MVFSPMDKKRNAKRWKNIDLMNSINDSMQLLKKLVFNITVCSRAEYGKIPYRILVISAFNFASIQTHTHLLHYLRHFFQIPASL